MPLTAGWQSSGATANYMSGTGTVNRRVPVFSGLATRGSRLAARENSEEPSSPESRATSLRGASAYLVLAHFPGERVAVDSQRVSRPGQAAVAAAEHPRDEPFLELVDGVVELDTPFDHLVDESVEPIADHDLLELLAGEAA